MNNDVEFNCEKSVPGNINLSRNYGERSTDRLSLSQTSERERERGTDELSRSKYYTNINQSSV